MSTLGMRWHVCQSFSDEVFLTPTTLYVVYGCWQRKTIYTKINMNVLYGVLMERKVKFD